MHIHCNALYLQLTALSELNCFSWSSRLAEWLSDSGVCERSFWGFFSFPSFRYANIQIIRELLRNDLKFTHHSSQSAEKSIHSNSNEGKTKQNKMNLQFFPLKPWFLIQHKMFKYRARLHQRTSRNLRARPRPQRLRATRSWCALCAWISTGHKFLFKFSVVENPGVFNAL